jgi:hypothetical protein
MEYALSNKFGKYKISETYIKLNIEYNIDNRRKIRSVLSRIAEKEILELKYKDDFIYYIEFDKGSLKSRVIIYGSLIIQGIIFYGELRQGLSQIYADLQTVSERVIENAKGEDNLIDNNIIRTERRTGLIGRLKRTIDRIDFLQSNLNDLGNNQVQNELALLRQNLANILELLDQQERQAVFDSLPAEIRHNLPIPEENGMEHIYNLYGLKPKDEPEDEE